MLVSAHPYAGKSWLAMIFIRLLTFRLDNLGRSTIGSDPTDVKSGRVRDEIGASEPNEWPVSSVVWFVAVMCCNSCGSVHGALDRCSAGLWVKALPRTIDVNATCIRTTCCAL